MGDFNAKVGSTASPNRIMGLHGLGTLNNNGERLKEICHEYRLVIGRTIFPHKNIHKYTWTSPDGPTRNQIDHICISQKWKQSLLDVRAWRGVDVQSDHILITCDLRLRITAMRKPAPGQRPKRLNTFKLKQEDTKKKFALAIQQELEENIEEVTDEELSSLYRRVGKRILGDTNPERKEWISDKTWSQIEERKEIRLSLLQQGEQASEELKELHRLICKNIKRSARRDKRNLASRIATEAQKAADKMTCAAFIRK